MRQVLPFQNADTYSNTTAVYLQPMQGGPSSSATESNVQAPWPVSGTLTNLRIELTTAPGAGKSRAYTLRVNGADTAATFTIADTSTVGTWAGSVAVTAGDLISLSDTPSGTPAGFVNFITVEFEPTANDESGYVYVVNTSSVDQYIGAFGAGATNASIGVGSDIANVSPLSGTIEHIYVRVDAAGSASTITFRLYKNGVAQDGTGGTPDATLTVVAGAAAVTDNLATSVSIVPGDLLYVEIELDSGAGRNVGWACRVAATTAGQSIMAAAFAAPVSTTGYAPLRSGETSSDWQSIGNVNRHAHAGAVGFKLSSLYVAHKTAPGSSTSVGRTVNVDDVATALAVTVSNTSTTGSDTADTIVVSAGSKVSIAHSESGSPVRDKSVVSAIQVEPDVVPLGSVLFTGYAPTLDFLSDFYPPVGSLLFTGYAPTLRVPTGIQQPDSPFIEIEINGTWVDVTADCSRQLYLRYGSWGARPLDRVAQTGVLRFSLRNGVDNVAGLLGYYSPGHANALAGFGRGNRVRVTMSYLGVQYRRFTGKIYEIAPTPGAFNDRWTHVLAYDWINELAEFVVREVAGQSSKRADELLTTLVAAMPSNAQPVASSYDVGVDTFPLAFDDLGGGANGLGVAASIALSELGYIYVKGNGTLRFENRQASQSASVEATFNNDMTGLVVPGSLNAVYNHVRVTIHPKATGASTVVLWAKSADVAPAVPAGESITVFGSYRDPNATSVAVGGTAMVTPVASTDYVANTAADGSGSNITADVSIVATFYGSSFKYVISNANAATAYLITLQARGKPIFDLTPITVESETAQSYGRRTLELDMPYQDDENVAQDIATYLRAQFESLAGQATEIVFNANRNFKHLNAALGLEPGSLITVTEDVTALTATTLRVSGIELSFDGPNVVWCRLATTPAFVSDAFILDDPTYGELDDDKLGFL